MSNKRLKIILSWGSGGDAVVPMAEVNLDRLSVLVVEDNSFIRVLFLGNVIRSLGVESVLLSRNASDAIDQIHKVNNDPAAAGISVIDLAVVDVVMPEVDGHMLLRWIRSACSGRL